MDLSHVETVRLKAKVSDQMLTGYEMSEKMQELRARFQEAKLNMEQEVQRMFKGGAQELFAKYPSLESFSWTQYTPYWCDGEACHFSADIDFPYINGEYLEDIEEREECKDLLGIAAEVTKFLANFDRDSLENLFGDHARITVTKGGVEVERHEEHN